MVLKKSSLFDKKRILIIAPHPDDDVIGCGAFLCFMHENIKSSNICIAYATSGANGICNKQLEQNERSLIREKEATAGCDFLGVASIFWRLPFYFAKNRTVSLQDNEIIEKSIREIKPDIIFVIDEDNDPNGTHGVVRDLCVRAISDVEFGGEVFGYRVWSPAYSYNESDVIVEFDEDDMKQKERLILFHESQIKYPAHPHKNDDFITMIKKSNHAASKSFNSKYKYVEGYKRIYQ